MSTDIHAALAADTSHRLSAWSTTAPRIFALTDAQINEAMSRVKDSQVKSVKAVLMRGARGGWSAVSPLSNPETLAARLPHAGAVLAKAHNAAFNRRFEGLVKRIDVIARARAQADPRHSMWSFHERARIAAYSLLLVAAMPDAFTPVQLAKLWDLAETAFQR